MMKKLKCSKSLLVNYLLWRAIFAGPQLQSDSSSGYIPIEEPSIYKRNARMTEPHLNFGIKKVV